MGNREAEAEVFSANYGEARSGWREVHSLGSFEPVAFHSHITIPRFVDRSSQWNAVSLVIIFVVFYT